VWDVVKGYWFYLAIAGFFLITMLTLLVVGCLEKHCVRDFAESSPEALPPPSPYFQAMNLAARDLGYQPGGVAQQNRDSSTYRCCIALWLSPDQKSLLCIGGGKLARMDYKRTWILSKLSDDRILQTMDLFASEDLSGTREIEALMNAHLPELHAFHQQRLIASGVDALTFRPAQLLAQWNELDQKRVVALIERGLARFTSVDSNTYRYTFKGAWINATTGFLRSMKRATAQKERASMKRPGS
jgi:hypothetical protein